MKARFQDLLKVFSFRLLFAVLSFIGAMYLFAQLTDEVIFEGQDAFDEKVFQALSHASTPNLIDVMKVFTFFGKHHFLVPAYLIMIILFLLFKKKTYAVETAIMGCGSTLFLFGLKFLFQRDRPELSHLGLLPGYSFPSGHALLTFVFCSLLVYFVWKSHMKEGWKWSLSILLILFSICIGISRIVLRVHYFTDVVAGFCLGYIWVLLGMWLQHRYITRKKLKELHLISEETPRTG